MESQPASAAPSAPPADATPISATVDAANRGDFEAFDRAELGKRAGAPVADIAAATTTVLAAAPVEERRKTRAEREQDRINETIRTASEAASAPLKAEIDRLKAQLQSTAPAEPTRLAAEPVVAATPEKKTPEYKRIMALDGAPKLADFDSVEEHAYAAAEFIDTVRTNERAASARASESHEARFAAERATDEAFFQQLDAAKTDPEFATKLSPEVKGLTPIEWLPRDAQGRAIDAQGQPIQTGPLHVVASELRKSPVVRDLMLHFSQHPEDLQKFAEMPAAVAAIRDPNVRLRAHVQHIVREFNRLEGRFAGHAPTPDSTAAPAAAAAETVTRSPITAAPPPPPTLRAVGSTSDPKASALARDDFAEYDRLEQQERLAKRTSPR